MGKKHKTDRVATTSPEISTERLAVLNELLPEAFSEDKLDVAKLQAVLGTHVQQGTERYSFTWAGKREAILTLQRPSSATLTPAKKISVDYDKTHNVFIQGDNLEVLKLLYKPYFGQVKMIYIDPPYNTGNDFVYPDNYTDPLDTYLKVTGQRDSEGNLVTSNPETSGRYHSAWLSMMYPRLFLARQLLADDGVIAVSIDDNEVHHLKLLLNETFGEENFVAQFVWKSRTGGDDRAVTGVSVDHEYVLVYGKQEGQHFEGVDKDTSKFSNPDNDPRGPWRSADMTGLATKDLRPNLHYKLSDPSTGITYPCTELGWAFSKQTMAKKIAEGRVLFPKKPDGRPRHKLFLNETRSLKKAIPAIITSVSTGDGTKEMNELFGARVFPFPKPSEYIRLFVEQTTKDDDIVMDFFAGSASTAHAVISQNRIDGGNRKFILVQLPEPVTNNTEAEKLHLHTIADIGRERIVRVIKKMKGEKQTKLGRKHVEDLGFRTFILGESNYKQWEETEQTTVHKYIAKMEGAVDSLKPGWKAEDVIYEVAIKEGYGLGISVEKLDIKPQIFRVTDPDKDQFFYIDLDDKVALSNLKALGLKKDDTFICRDSALDDTTAANLALQCRLKTI